MLMTLSNLTMTDNCTHAIAMRKGNILPNSKMDRKVICGMSTGIARISQTSTSLASQTIDSRVTLLYLWPDLFRSAAPIAFSMQHAEGSILKVIGAAERKGSGLRDYHWVVCNTVEFSYAGWICL